MTEHETLLVEGSRSALIVQDLRNDVIIEGFSKQCSKRSGWSAARRSTSSSLCR